MQQYIVYAWDGTDNEALERRLSARSAHLDNSRIWKGKGNFILAGAMLSEEGKMIGSTVVMQFETREQLQEWLDTEPYVVERVWEKVDIRPFRIANI